MKRRVYNTDVLGESYQVIETEFEDLSDLVAYIRETENLPLRADASIKGDYLFTNTYSFSDAMRQLTQGMNEGFDKFIKKKKSIEFLKPDVYKREEPELSKIGYRPNVPLYLKGVPNNMYRYVEEEEPKQFTMSINCAYSSYTLKDQIVNTGVITISIAEILELLGYKVVIELYSITQTENPNQISYIHIPLKKAEEEINYKKVYFPLCSPSFQRRIIFRIEELTSELDKSFYDGFGRPSNHEQTSLILGLGDNKLLVSSPTSMGIEGYNIILDAYAAFKKMNIEKYFSVNEQIEKVSFLGKS
jgi:hypothetical protein